MTVTALGRFVSTKWQILFPESASSFFLNATRAGDADNVPDSFSAFFMPYFRAFRCRKQTLLQIIIPLAEIEKEAILFSREIEVDREPEERAKEKSMPEMWFAISALLLAFGCPHGLTENGHALRGSAKSTSEVYTIWPKSSGEPLSGGEGFPWYSCNISADVARSNKTCPGIVDYFNHFCSKTSSSNRTSAQMSKKKIVLRLLPGVHAISLGDCFSCENDLAIKGSGASRTSILATYAQRQNICYDLNGGLFCFEGSGALLVEEITFRANVSSHYYFITVRNASRFEMHKCRFLELSKGRGAVQVYAVRRANSFSHGVLISDCEFHHQGQETNDDEGFTAVFLTVLKDEADSRYTSLHLVWPFLKVLRSNFILHLPKTRSAQFQQPGKETWEQ